MRSPYFWIVAVGCMLGLPNSVCAQPISSPKAVDDPRQRWLPLPPSAKTDLMEQIEYLQWLRDRLDIEKSIDNERSLPELNELQKEMIGQAIQQWQKSGGSLATDADGNPSLPDLSRIPKEWIEAAQSDPKLRNQAARLLEQYARDHQPTPQDRSTGGPRTAEPPIPFQPSPGNTTDKAAKNRNGPLDETRPSDSESFSALAKLFNQLKAVEELRSPFGTDQDDTQAQPSPSRSSSRSQPVQRPLEQNRRPMQQRQQRAAQQSNAPMRSGMRPQQPWPQNGQSEGAQPLSPFETRNVENNSSRLPDEGNNLRHGEPSSSQDPMDSFGVPQNTRSNAIDMGSSGSLDHDIFGDNQTTPPNSRLPHKKSGIGPGRQVPISGASKNDSPRLSTTTESELSMEQQISRFGLAGTLQRMLEKRLKEHNLANSSGPTKTESRPSRSMGPSNLDQPAEIRTKPKAGGAGTRKPTEVAASKAGPRATPDQKSLSDTLGEVWKSLSSSSRSSGRVSTSVDDPSHVRDFHWNGRFAEIMLLVAALVGCSLWLIRKRIQNLASAQVNEAQLVNSILAQGIHTRNDVVRAFHCFVKRTTEPVASWWTHKRAAHRLSESMPSITAAMQVLASVYEQARYAPPEVELSQEQLHRVQLALQHCDASQN